MKRHLKTVSAAKSWPLERRALKFVTRPLPKSAFDLGMPLSLAIRRLGYARTTHEIKALLNNREVLVDKKPVKEIKTFVGLMDLVEFPTLKSAFIVLINRKGKICLVAAENADLKLCRITGKKMSSKGKIQLSTHDSRTFIIEGGDHKIGDTLVVQLPKQEIKDSLKLEKGASAYIFGGKRMGQAAKVEAVLPDKVILKSDSEDFETEKRFVFVIGKDNPLIRIK